MKKLLLICLSAIMLMSAFALTGCEIKEPAKYEKLVVGYDNKFAPMGYVKDGEDVGFDIDLAKAIGVHLGVNMVMTPIDWSAKEAELKTGKIDLIWNGFTITDKRKETVKFSNAYMGNDQVIVIRKSDEAKYKDSKDLAGKKLAVQLGSSAKDALLANDNIKGNEVIELGENATIITELVLGRHEAAVMDSVVANFMAKTNSAVLVLNDEVLASEEYGIGMRMNAVNLESLINGAMKALYENGEINTIADKYGLKAELLVDSIKKG